MVDEAALLQAGTGSVIAPAGCGKTELIARAVKRLGRGRCLVLTHTHAGVRVLRDRLRRAGVAREAAHVETIAGWCLRYSAAYPATSKLQASEPTRSEWGQVYSGALEVLEISAIRDVVKASYAALFVDEYQDCTREQHEIIKKLAKVLPAWVLGDPLQGIFRFAGGTLSWSSDVEHAFPRIGELSEPWRWRGRNDRLGRWLLDIRAALVNGAAIDLSGAPVKWSECTPENQRAEAFRLSKGTGTVVAIRKWPKGAHDFARSLGGAYLSIEEIECTDLLAFADSMDKFTGGARAARIIEFGAQCMTEVSTALGPAQGAFSSGRIPDPGRYKESKAVAALVSVATGGEAVQIKQAMLEIEHVEGARTFRRELWREGIRTMDEFQRRNHPSLRSAAWSLRNRQRYTGREPETRSVARTLLIKGLEFEHALVLDAAEFEDAQAPGDGARLFYVAATRGASSLAVLSAAPTIQFTPAPI